MTDADEMAYEAFATLHPLAAYATDPERFLAYAIKKTGRRREDIVKALRDTCLGQPDDPEALTMRLLCLLLGHRWMLIAHNWGDDDSEHYYPFWSEDYCCMRCGKERRVY